jgi:coenzyme F420-0:L-glutamate ligase / coenzyme F420-1:gamma-L-glutamate ligase
VAGGSISATAIEGIPEIRPGDDLADFIWAAARDSRTPITDTEVLVVAHKVVSKSEGRIRRLSDVQPGSTAIELAEQLGRDPRHVQVVLEESREVVRASRGTLICVTHHGFVCANAGVDQSNVDADTACLLPEDADRSAAALRARLRDLTGHDLAIIVADTFGRPWREGLVNVAVGLSGLEPIVSYLGQEDPAGHVLQATILALADELAGAAEPVMGKLDRVPVAIVRGLDWPRGEGSSRALLRDPARDLFR